MSSDDLHRRLELLDMLIERGDLSFVDERERVQALLSDPTPTITPSEAEKPVQGKPGASGAIEGGSAPLPEPEPVPRAEDLPVYNLQQHVDVLGPSGKKSRELSPEWKKRLPNHPAAGFERHCQIPRCEICRLNTGRGLRPHHSVYES